MRRSGWTRPYGVLGKVLSRRRVWQIAFVVVAAIPLFPEIVTLTIWATAELSGCQVGDEKVCAVGPISSVGNIIRLATEAGILVGVRFTSWVAGFWLALCYLSIFLGWSGLITRLILAFFVNLIFAFAPFGPMISILHLENPKCLLNEGGVGSCVVFGDDVGGIAHESVHLSVRYLTEQFYLERVLIALGAFGLYMLFLLGARFFLRKRAKLLT
jgi:hypothetical protein